MQVLIRQIGNEGYRLARRAAVRAGEPAGAFCQGGGKRCRCGILDLEDAVSPDDKASARAGLFGVTLDIPVIVRINGAGTRWHDDDCAALQTLVVAAIMLPKAERVEDLARLRAIAPIVALVETACGLAEARMLAKSSFATRLAFGSVDYAADLACDPTREALLAARSELVLASRLGGLPPPLDGVTKDLASATAAHDDARAARALGFGGKLLIHPSQAERVVAAFRPSPEEIDWASRVMASGAGAVRLDGMMIDEPVRIRARAILARAGTAAAS